MDIHSTEMLYLLFRLMINCYKYSKMYRTYISIRHYGT